MGSEIEDKAPGEAPLGRDKAAPDKSPGRWLAFLRPPPQAPEPASGEGLECRQGSQHREIKVLMRMITAFSESLTRAQAGYRLSAHTPSILLPRL